MVEFKLPDIGEGMHDGEITKWLVKEGDAVKRDQPVVEVQTEKVNAELTSPVAGVIAQILFAEGDTVEVGATLFHVKAENEAAMPAVSESAAKKPKEMPPLSLVSQSGSGPNRVIATPFVRQMAREMKIDIEQVKGTGLAGRVTEEDLLQFSAGKKVNAVQPTETMPVFKKGSKVENNEERVPLKGIRKKIAEHLTKSVSIIPHVTHVDEVEMDALKAFRDELRPFAERKNIKLTYLPFFIKAIVFALKEFRTLNASIDDESNEIILKNYYHIGIATDTKDGLMVPVVRNVDQKTIFELAEEIHSLASAAREGKLSLEQMNGSTFTISNVGPIGGLHATPIINHPEVAILALHKMEPRMVVRDGEGVIRLMMNMSLSFDHRLIDGVTAVRFTNRIKELVENPHLLFLEMS